MSLYREACGQSTAPQSKGVVAVLVGAAVMASCAEPFSRFAGGELSGAIASPPAQWRDVPEVVQLEVRPAEPYSVNVWCVVVDNDLHIATSSEDSGWISLVRSDGEVRLRMGETLYPLRAVEVGDAPAIRAQVRDAYIAKYGGSDGLFGLNRLRRNQASKAVEEGFVFRLERRSKRDAA